MAFSEVFNRHFTQGAAHCLMNNFSQGSPVTYQDAEVTIPNILAIVGDVAIIEVETDSGATRKEYRRSLHVMRDQTSKWGGLPNPKVNGSFIIDGEVWSIEDRGQPIEGVTEAFATCSLVRKRRRSQATQGYRKY